HASNSVSGRTFRSLKIAENRIGGRQSFMRLSWHMSFCIDIYLTIWYNESWNFQSILIKLGRGITYGIYKNK
ncbi:hypothetical protein KHY84_11505, partial [butyrate-producing bacterium]|nr:hypothetical protein [butyrate-producing bacterium]